MKKKILVGLLGLFLVVGVGTVNAKDYCEECMPRVAVNSFYSDISQPNDDGITIVKFREGVKFYVNRLFWITCDFKAKRTFVLILASWYCYNGSGVPRCEVYDAHSGRRLAKCGVWGVKIY